MFRSIWFWVVLGVGLLLFLGRDQIASYVDKIPLQTTPRTTNTQALASATPRVAHTVTVARPLATTKRNATSTPGPARTPTRAASSSLTTPASRPTVVTTPYTIYVVKKGDTLYRIAKRYNTTVPALQRINGISDPSKLAIGQELKVPRRPSPTRPSTPAPKPGTKPYKVRPGDTLSSIARKFNTSVGTLQKLNNFPNPNKLPVGTVILVPATASTRPPVTATRSLAASPTQPAETGKDQEVRIMPVLTGAAPPASSSGATATPAPLASTPTPTPMPTLPSICEGRQEAVFVWGVSFCVPPGWKLQEYAHPYRTALLTKDEATGDRSIYAISRLEGSPNAPLSWTMRQAKTALTTEIASSSIIPGGLTEPENWTSATEFEIANVKGQVSEAITTYAKTGHTAHVRIIVFNAANQRWRIIIVAPEELWQGYDVTVFPYIARTLEVF